MKINQLKAKLKDKRGFTLIELIVVVAIIAVLLALLVPNVLRFVEQAAQTAADANAKTVYVAAQVYIADQYTQGNKVTSLDLDTLVTNDYIPNSIKGKATITISNGELQGVRWRKTNTSVLGEYPK